MRQKKLLACISLTVLLLFLSVGIKLAAAESIVGHISFVENEATVVRADQAENRLVVNLPIVPGDTVVTSDNGRCELQFDNGTVIRLDKNSRLRVTTMQAPTLTSRWKVTTLHLLQGQVYTLPQTYDREMFQIITPNAAVNLKNRTAATIQVKADLGTVLFSDAGKFEVLYTDARQAVQKFKVKKGQAYAIGADHFLAIHHEKRNLEFVAWNEYVDRHFKELHYGISKVPPKLKFGNSALVYWAEKWSSLVGEWIYDELFGYVWKPADDRFAYSARPFFNADYVRVNGQLFLVPQQAWGWVPAHMGTWVWLKTGWTWIPGNWFHSGIESLQLCNYFCYVYGDYDLYCIYRGFGNEAWREHYYRKFHKHHKKLPMKDLPRELQKIIKRINKAPLAVVAERLNIGRALPALDPGKVQPLVAPQNPLTPFSLNDKAVPLSAVKDNVDSRFFPEKGLGEKVKSEKNRARLSVLQCDWNPDSVWAFKNGLSISYSSAKNAVVCPELNISSDQARFSNPLVMNELADLVRSFVSNGNSSNSESTISTATAANGQSVSNGVSVIAVTPAGNGQTVKKDDGGK